VAAVIAQEIGIEPKLIEGGRGEFTVWIGDELVAQKGPHGFPSDDEILAAVQKTG